MLFPIGASHLPLKTFISLMLTLRFRRDLVLEDYTEDLASKTLSQPGVLYDGQFKALAAEHGVVVCVDGPTHTFNDHQICAPLPDDSGQDFVQATEEWKLNGGHGFKQ